MIIERDAHQRHERVERTYVAKNVSPAEEKLANRQISRRTRTPPS